MCAAGVGADGGTLFNILATLVQCQGLGGSVCDTLVLRGGGCRDGDGVSNGRKEPGTEEQLGS